MARRFVDARLFFEQSLVPSRAGAPDSGGKRPPPVVAAVDGVARRAVERHELGIDRVERRWVGERTSDRVAGGLGEHAREARAADVAAVDLQPPGLGAAEVAIVDVSSHAMKDRFRGALLGLAMGDAVGTTVEFSPPGTFAPVTDMVGGGPFDLPAGAWTDDTSMALCLAESLVERGWDPVDQLERYVRWYREGYRSSIGRCFDIGNATRAALERFERTREPFPGDAAPGAAGNGPLMKLAPVVLAFSSDPAEAIRYAGESARTTHGAPEAIDACRYFAALLLEVEPPRDLHEKIAGLPLDREPPE